MPQPDFQRDLVIAIAKELHELYNGFGVCPRVAKIETDQGTVRFTWASEVSFWLGSYTFYLEDGEWKMSIYNRKAGISNE